MPKITTYHDSDPRQIQKIVSYSENKIIDGKSEYFRIDGTIQKSVEYKDGVKHGMETNFYPTGNIRYIKEFKNGKEDGDYKYWDKDGKILWDIKYENGLKNYEASKTFNDVKKVGETFLVHFDYMTDDPEEYEVSEELIGSVVWDEAEQDYIYSNEKGHTLESIYDSDRWSTMSKDKQTHSTYTKRLGFIHPVRNDDSAVKLATSINWDNWTDDNGYFSIESILYNQAKWSLSSEPDDSIDLEVLGNVMLYAKAMNDRKLYELVTDKFVDPEVSNIQNQNDLLDIVLYMDYLAKNESLSNNSYLRSSYISFKSYLNSDNYIKEINRINRDEKQMHEDFNRTVLNLNSCKEAVINAGNSKDDFVAIISEFVTAYYPFDAGYLSEAINNHLSPLDIQIIQEVVMAEMDGELSIDYTKQLNMEDINSLKNTLDNKDLYRSTFMLSEENVRENNGEISFSNPKFKFHSDYTNYSEAEEFHSFTSSLFCQTESFINSDGTGVKYRFVESKIDAENTLLDDEIEEEVLNVSILMDYMQIYGNGNKEIDLIYFVNALYTNDEIGLNNAPRKELIERILWNSYKDLSMSKSNDTFTLTDVTKIGKTYFESTELLNEKNYEKWENNMNNLLTDKFKVLKDENVKAEVLVEKSSKVHRQR